MLVRSADTSDIESIIPLVGQYWAFDGIDGFCPEAVRKPLGELLANRQLGEGWLAIDHGATVAYLLMVYVFSLEHQGLTAEIDEFFVASPYRGAGLGLEMLRQAEQAACYQGCTNLSLQVSDQNQPARQFYFRAGFAERRGYGLLDKAIDSGD